MNRHFYVRRGHTWNTTILNERIETEWKMLLLLCSLSFATRVPSISGKVQKYLNADSLIQLRQQASPHDDKVQIYPRQY